MSNEIMIVFGTETGNAEYLAERAAKMATNYDNHNHSNCSSMAFQKRKRISKKGYFEIKDSHFTQKFLSIILTLIITLPVITAENDEDQFTLSGQVFSGGEIADTTYVKVVPMQSVISESGNYSFEGISPGEHIIRAYFMNNGHTVVYRKMLFTEDVNLDWYEGMNWITTKVFDENGGIISDSSMTEIELIETNENKALNDGRVEFGPYDVNQYFTLKAKYGDIDNSTQYVHFKLERGSAASNQYPDLNDFQFHHGKNSKYGFIKDSDGNPVSDVLVSNGDISYMTNSDGFYLLQNLDVGSSYTLTFQQFGQQISEPLDDFMTTGPGWLNQTIDIELISPGNISFLTPVQTLPMTSIELEWSGSEYSDYYSVYSGPVVEENLIYRGLSNTFMFEPSEPGMIDFNVVANNSNGSTENLNSLRIIFLPSQSGESIWNVGMNWDYRVEYTPSGTLRDVTMTMIGSEKITDSFGHERDSFLLRLTGDYQLPDEKSYRWVDSETLLNLHTYWLDDPSSSSYFTEGSLGWNFTDETGNPGNLLEDEDNLTMHFNRTNVIGVPGHPDGYDDTYNIVSIEDNVMVTTSAGVFSTRYIRITDNSDSMASWELWYNETVKNWVKIIDRLSGSHSDKVDYELTSYEVPTTPQFISEEGEINSKGYEISWANYPGAKEYQLLQNNEIIYQGNMTTFLIENNNDAVYTYLLRGMMEGYYIEGDTLELQVNYIPPKIVLSINSDIINEGDSVTLNWPHVESSEWYGIIVQDEEGNILEMYNGSENQVTLEELSVGQNRIRINGMINGKVSDYSDSVFVIVLEDEESSFSSGELTIGFMLIVLVATNIIFRQNRSREENK